MSFIKQDEQEARVEGLHPCEHQHQGVKGPQGGPRGGRVLGQESRAEGGGKRIRSTRRWEGSTRHGGCQLIRPNWVEAGRTQQRVSLSVSEW